MLLVFPGLYIFHFEKENFILGKIFLDTALYGFASLEETLDLMKFLGNTSRNPKFSNREFGVVDSFNSLVSMAPEAQGLMVH